MKIRKLIPVFMLSMIALNGQAEEHIKEVATIPMHVDAVESFYYRPRPLNIPKRESLVFLGDVLYLESSDDNLN